jgi:predicted RNA-binding Zn-ribbon protein involved in translation (DUF1610 family)
MEYNGLNSLVIYETGCNPLKKIYECKQCGAHHLASDWVNTTFKISQVATPNYTIHYCPSCEQATALQDIDFLANDFDARFGPYSKDKKEILDQFPDMIKWL